METLGQRLTLLRLGISQLGEGLGRRLNIRPRGNHGLVEVDPVGRRTGRGNQGQHQARRV